MQALAGVFRLAVAALKESTEQQQGASSSVGEDPAELGLTMQRAAGLLECIASWLTVEATQDVALDLCAPLACLTSSVLEYAGASLFSDRWGHACVLWMCAARAHLMRAHALAAPCTRPPPGTPAACHDAGCSAPWAAARLWRPPTLCARRCRSCAAWWGRSWCSAGKVRPLRTAMRKHSSAGFKGHVEPAAACQLARLCMLLAREARPHARPTPLQDWTTPLAARTQRTTQKQWSKAARP